MQTNIQPLTLSPVKLKDALAAALEIPSERKPKKKVEKG